MFWKLWHSVCHIHIASDEASETVDNAAHRWIYDEVHRCAV
jgi:hypothetical protein